MMGLPPRSVIRESNSKVSGFGELALPKNSTQKAGSKENEAKEGECGIEDPAAVDKTLSLIASGQPLTGVALARRTALMPADYGCTRREYLRDEAAQIDSMLV